MTKAAQAEFVRCMTLDALIRLAASAKTDAECGRVTKAAVTFAQQRPASAKAEIKMLEVSA